MFRRIAARMGLSALAGLGLLLVVGPARADTQGWPLLQGLTQGTYSPARSYRAVGPSPFGSYSPSYYAPPAYSRSFAPGGYPPAYTPETGYAAVPRSAARVTVHVPSPNAELWFNRVRLPDRGTTRTFSSPPLTAGDNYHYTVRARWLEDGRPVDVTYTVPVFAGRPAVVDFRDTDRGVTAVGHQAPVDHRDDDIPDNQGPR